MGTDKRERQRANKALKNEQVARARTRRKGTRLAVIVGGVIVAVVALAVAANVFVGGDDEPTTLPATDAESVLDPDTGEVVPAGCPPAAGTDQQTQTFDAAPPMCLDPNVSYSAVVTTDRGEFTVELDQAAAPLTVNNFVFLARNQYFDDTNCHRIIPDFVVQCGDPEGTGTGGPGYRFADELPEAGAYQLGSLAMANSGPNTNGSQFFIITGDQGVALPPQYSLFGEVVSGFDDTVEAMAAAGTPSGAPSTPVQILDVEIQVD